MRTVIQIHAMKILTTSLLALALGGGLSLSAEDWPEFRGPLGEGHAKAKNLPLEWSSGETNKNIAWKQAIPGKGWSSPVVVKGKIYLTTAVTGGDTSDLKLQTLCLNEADGKILWTTDIFTSPPGQIHSKNSNASPTPIVEGDRLYVHFGHYGTACLDLTGKIIWRNDELKYSPLHGNGGSPIIVDDILFFSCDGLSDPFVVALEKQTGKVRWKVNREAPAKNKFSFSTALLITVNGKKQIISPGSGAVVAYDPVDGKEIWRARYGEGYSVVPRPVYGHGMIFIGTGYDRPTAMGIRVDGTGDVTDTHVAWTVNRSAPNTPSLLLIGDEVYMVSDGGIASCLDAKTGTVHWQERVGGNYSASPLFANDRIYLQNETGTGVVLAPGKEFKKLATNELDERTLASYAVVDDALYIRGEQHLFKVKQP